MSDDLDPLVRALAALGLDESSVRALLLLPLVEVAWGDGEIQDAERALLLRLGEEHVQVGAEAALLLTDWLRHRPSEAYFGRGRELLRTLAGVGAPGFDAAALEAVAGFADDVARAAGGFLGFGRVSAGEAEAIARLQKQLREAAVAPEDLTLPDREAARQRYTVALQTTSLAGLASRGAVRSGDTAVPVTREGVWVGSDPACAVVVPLAEPRHCRVFERQRKFYVADASRGGTRVDGERVAERRLLGGEAIGLGPASVTFKMMRRSG